MMCELPPNVVIADAFLDHFDGFSIGSNDMTQLTLGLDRDSALVAAGFDERDAAVKFMISTAIKACKARGKYVRICGQGPERPPRPRRMAARATHRHHVTQPGHRCRDSTWLRCRGPAASSARPWIGLVAKSSPRPLRLDRFAAPPVAPASDDRRARGAHRRPPPRTPP